MKPPNTLPPMTALQYFEVSAKLLSFTKAANELDVSLGAVSRQIKLLETHLSVSLFERTRRGVELTSAGQLLYQTISNNFAQIRNVCQRLKNQQTKQLTLASTTAFASQWLMPRLGEFWQAYPEITLSHSLANNLGSLNRYQANFYIRYGSGFWSGHVATKLYHDELFPVCSPEYYQANKDKPLSQHTLLQMLDDDSDWSAWDEWLQTQNLMADKFNWRYFNNYIIAIDVAQRGQGIAMGWKSLIEESIKQGKLVKFSQSTVTTPGAYYLTWPENQALGTEAECFRHWILQQSS